MTKTEVEKLLSRPTISVPEAGAIIGLSRNPAYAAAKKGEIPTIKFGHSLKVPTASLRKILGLDPETKNAA